MQRYKSEFVNMTNLKKRIEEIPGENGWWKTGGYDFVLDASVYLLQAGWTEDQIVSFVKGMYFAVAGEFGE